MRLLSILLALAGLLMVSASTPPAQAEEGAGLFDPQTGLRITRYRAPVPPDVPGGTRVDIDGLDVVLRDQEALLLDVTPAIGGGFDEATGNWRIAKPHQDIPGSIWLPDVGKGLISARLQHYLAQTLERVTGGEKGRAVVVYCQSDCWMGWNAVQRIAALGYSRVFWYPDGIDGWRDWERKFAEAVPVPVPPLPENREALPGLGAAADKCPLKETR